MNEQRNAKIMFAKSGGNASQNATTTRISLPKKWIAEMGIDADDRNVVMEFDGTAIVIKKGTIE